MWGASASLPELRTGDQGQPDLGAFAVDTKWFADTRSGVIPERWPRRDPYGLAACGGECTIHTFGSMYTP